MGLRIALAGNPNCGKTTMFNELTGASQYVGNWPGVTVEKKEGTYTRNKEVVITDLPGVYSLSPYSPEEMVTRDYLLEGQPDVVINLIDATNLERNLYLTTQILDVGVAVVVALNMMDLVEKNGDKIDIEKLSKKLGCPVVPTSALKNRGMSDLMDTAIKAAQKGVAPVADMRFDTQVEEALAKVIDVLEGRVPTKVMRWYSIKLLEGEQKTLDSIKLSANELSSLSAIRQSLEDARDDDVESIVTGGRYDAIGTLVSQVLKKSLKDLTASHKIDRVVTNRWLGIPIFVVVMMVVYLLSVSVLGKPLTDWTTDGLFGEGWLVTGSQEFDEADDAYKDDQAQIDAYLSAAEEAGISTDGVADALKADDPTPDDDDLVATFQDEAANAQVMAQLQTEDGVEDVDADAFAEAVEAEEPDPSDYGMYVPGLSTIATDFFESMQVAPWMQGLVVDGVIAGVGSVLGFVPQMIILFLLLSLLEACGYMARVAFIMDRVFRKFGLSGKSFIPMLIASGCGVPAIMATKTIENEKDRRMTIMTTTMIPCGAKLPIIALVFGAVAGGNSISTWWVAPMFYFLGVIAIIVSGIMLRKTRMFAGEATPFIMELPQYHLPAAKTVLLSTWERVRSFIVKAGTIIFLSSVVIWFLMNFGVYDGQFGLLDATMDNYLEYSLMAGLGTIISYIFIPLGFGDWQSAATTVTGLIAKENVVATVGIITSLGSDAGEADPSMWAAFGTMLGGMAPAIMAFCAFNLLCAPCVAAMGAIRRQMASPKWTWFAIGYMTVFAWCIGLIIYQLGTLFMDGTFTVWTGVAIIVLVGMLVQLFRPMPCYSDRKGTARLEAEKNGA